MLRIAHNFRFFADWLEQLEHPDFETRAHEPCQLGPVGRRCLDHAVERTADARHVEGGPGPRRRVHGRVEAGRVAPLTASLLADIARDAGLPPGVLNVVQGIGEEVGQAFVSHPDVAISFTGSVPTARAIARPRRRT